MNTYDVLIVGAGYIGTSVAYHLVRLGLKTALIDKDGVAAGASAANYGNIQVQDAELEHSLPMIRAGLAAWEGVEEMLGCTVGRRRLGSLLLIENERQWQLMVARLPALHRAGIQAELVPAARLPELEPLLDPSTVLGACYHEAEGQVYPFALLSAFVHRAREKGLALHFGGEVIGIDVHGGRVQGLRTTQDDLSAGVVILCTGAWTPGVARLFGRKWAVPHVHGQALVTEAAPALPLRNHIASAAFFEEVHGHDTPDGVDAVLAISQTAEGHFLLGEAAAPSLIPHKEATASGQVAIARLVSRYFPALRRLRVLRGWAAPVAFTYDGLPFFGPVPGIQGLFVATAFKSTVIVTPLVGATVAQWVENGHTDLDLTPFTPDRLHDNDDE